ncbi:hypothetical protein RJ640_030648 [Escallonia rubra]|uniref:CCHC-type domain-containing protein n=1 Tax=Escallonia rubra TaxID=112253 RepID=A0AA88R0V0_9ASTE|nr:hypothetical protein RJ640_030648 [Escallonia rubra]
MSNNTTMKYACEQFNRKTNFGIWQSTVKDILVQQGLLKPLLGNKPESMDQDDWEELQAKAVSTIRLNLAPKVKYQVLTETSPTALWQKLEKIYMSKSLSNRLYLKKDLYQLRMDEGSDLGDHISEFNQLVSQLSSIDETLLVDDVMSALIDLSRVNGTSSSSQGEGLVVRGRSRSKNSGHGKDRSKSRGKQNKSSIECWYCKEIGHIARKCPERKDKKNGKKHVNNANVDEEDDKSSGGGVMKVSKGAMVIMKGQKIGNLYKLIGNTVIGGASVSTHVGSSNDNSELWHKRLGHLSEGGMLELHKRKLLQGVKSCNDFCKFCVFGKHKRAAHLILMKYGGEAHVSMSTTTNICLAALGIPIFYDPKNVSARLDVGFVAASKQPQSSSACRTSLEVETQSLVPGVRSLPEKSMTGTLKGVWVLLTMFGGQDRKMEKDVRTVYFTAALASDGERCYHKSLFIAVRALRNEGRENNFLFSVAGWSKVQTVAALGKEE